MNISTILNFIYNLHNFEFEAMSTLEPQKNLDDYAKCKIDEEGFYNNYKNDLVKKIIDIKSNEKSGDINKSEMNKFNEFNINYAQLEKLYSVAKNNK
jgi:hypothetical protein